MLLLFLSLFAAESFAAATLMIHVDTKTYDVRLISRESENLLWSCIEHENGKIDERIGGSNLQSIYEFLSSKIDLQFSIQPMVYGELLVKYNGKHQSGNGNFKEF
eukprot:NODE_724_length_4442_cov_0.403868.p5 type:complete len:105 gc:universal NODE_724_length_4442_cov_0.403868:383-697(+)